MLYLPFLSLIGLLLSVLGGAGAHFRFLSPLAGFYLCLMGCAFMTVLLIPAIIPAIIPSISASSSRGQKTAWVTIVLGGGSVSLLALLFFLALKYPGNDITTDPQNPPSLEMVEESQAINLRLAEPLFSPLSPQILYPLVERVIREDFPNVQQTSDTKNRIEFSSESALFRFVDDVVVEVRAAKEANQSRVDFRSRSRLGKSDLGANTRRIEQIKNHINQAVESSRSHSR